MKRHFPQGLHYIFFASAFFMVSLISFNALLVLFVTQHYKFADGKAYALYAAFISLFYSASLIGGHLGSRFSHKQTAITGGLLATVGLMTTVHGDPFMLYLGLALYIVGSGCFIPNIMVAGGQLYQKNDPKRDSGYTVLYIGTNIGALFAAFSSGYVAKYFGGATTMFFIAAICMVFALSVFILGFRSYRFQPETPYLTQHNDWRHFIPIVLTVLIFAAIVYELLNHQQLSNIVLITAGVLAYLTTIFLAFRLHGHARLKLLVFVLLLFVSLTFWALYSLAPSALTIFIERNVDRQVFGHIIPTASFYGLNPFFIITVGSFLSYLWIALSHKGVVLTPATKFAIGTLLMGAGYVMLLPGIYYANILGFVGVGWIVFSYFLQTTGELFVGPIGYSMVGALVPAEMEGTMMGLFQLSTGVAGAISGFLAAATSGVKVVLDPLKTDPLYEHAFFLYGGITILAALLLILFLPIVNRLIRGEASS